MTFISASIAFPNYRTKEDELDMLGTTKIKREMSENIKNADFVEWMVGGIDLSLNDDTQKKLNIRWQPQFYGFAEVTSREALSKVLGDMYVPTKHVPRPVHTKNLMDLQKPFHMPSRPILSGVSPTARQ